MAAFQRRYYAGGGVTTTLSAAMASTDTTFSITADTGWPGSVGTDFFVVIDRGTASEEKILCSSNTGTTVTVANRGQDGTSAVAHSNAATVSLCITALDGDEANQVTHLLGNAAEGALVYGKGTGTLPTTLTVGTSGQVLTSNGTDPAWADANTLVTYTEGAILYGKGSGTAPTALSVGTNGQVLTSNGTDPAWVTPSVVHPISETQYGPTTDPAYTISTTAMTAVDTTNLTSSSFTVPASGKIKVTVSGTSQSTTTNTTVYMAMLNHSGGTQVGDTVAAITNASGTIKYTFTKTYLITGLSAGTLQLDLAAYAPSASTLNALVSATPAKNDIGPITIIIETA